MDAEEELHSHRDLEAHLTSASRHMVIKNFEEAIEYYEHALDLIEVQKLHTVALYNLCIIKYSLCQSYIGNTEFTKARKFISPVVETYGTRFPILFYALAVAHVQEKNFFAAENIITSGLRAIKKISDKSALKATWPATNNLIPESECEKLINRLQCLKSCCFALGKLPEQDTNVEGDEAACGNASLWKETEEEIGSNESLDKYKMQLEDVKQHDKSVQVNPKGVCQMTQTVTTSQERTKKEELLIEENNKLKKENKKLKEEIVDFELAKDKINEEFNLLVTWAESIAIDLSKIDIIQNDKIKKLEFEVETARKTINSQRLMKNEMVKESEQFHRYFAVVVSNLANLVRIFLDGHSMRCQKMMHDLEKTLVLLTSDSRPSRELCSKQLKMWKQEFENVTSGLKQWDTYIQTVGENNYQPQPVPAVLTQLQDYGSCLQDNFYAAVNNLSRKLKTQNQLQEENEALKQEISKLKDVLQLTTKSSLQSLQTSWNNSPPYLNLSYDLNGISLNPTPINSEAFNADFRKLMSLKDCSMMSQSLSESMNFCRVHPVTSPSLNSILATTDTKTLKAMSPKASLCTSETSKSLKVNESTSLTNISMQSLERPEIPNQEQMQSEALIVLPVHGPKLYRLIAHIQSKIQNATYEDLLTAVCLISQKRQHLPGISKDAIVDLVKTELREMSRENSCCICMELYEFLPLTTLPCNHTFHTACINKWIIKNGPSSPICKIHL